MVFTVMNGEEHEALDTHGLRALNQGHFPIPIYLKIHFITMQDTTTGFSMIPRPQLGDIKQPNMLPSSFVDSQHLEFSAILHNENQTIFINQEKTKPTGLVFTKRKYNYYSLF